jgi:hypothetical protein
MAHLVIIVATRMSFRLTIVCVAALLLAFIAPYARAQAPWDGLEELQKTAEEAGIWLKGGGPKLDLGGVSPADAILIVGPTEPLPVAPLTTFLREGGRIALLDDFGVGDRLLSAYQVTRGAPPASDVPTLRGDPNLLVAYPASEHPLVTGVSLLLANRATSLHHPELKPVFTFGRSSSALVLAGAVGAGRLVAVGDASTVINQLMALPSHRVFAKNLLSYLSRPGGRVWLVAPHTEVTGNYGNKKPGLSRIDGYLRRLAHPDLPPAVLSLIGLALCGIAVVLSVGTLPRRSPYVRPDLFPQATVFAGFAGRVAAAEREGVNLVWSLLDYKREIEAELVHRYDLKGPFDAREALAAAEKVGAPRRDVDSLRELLSSLEQLSRDHDAEDKKARISVSELGNVVRKGEELLARLREPRG